jgi:hypothetical protein
VGDDPRFRHVRGIEKRFFDEDSVKALFGPPWEVRALAERTTDRFGSAKTLFEIVARVPQRRDLAPRRSQVRTPGCSGTFNTRRKLS